MVYLPLFWNTGKFWAPSPTKNLVRVGDTNSYPISLEGSGFPEQNESNGSCWSGMYHEEILSRLEYISDTQYLPHLCRFTYCFLPLLWFHWPAVKQFCRLYIMITASTRPWPGWDDVELLLPAGWTATKFLHRSQWKWSEATVVCSLSCLDVPSYIGSPGVECKNTGLICWENKKKKSLGIRNLKLLPPFWKHREE